MTLSVLNSYQTTQTKLSLLILASTQKFATTNDLAIWEPHPTKQPLEVYLLSGDNLLHDAEIPPKQPSLITDTSLLASEE